MPVSPRKLAANRRNLAKAGPLTPDGWRRLRAAALRDKPWRFSSGPKSAAGRKRSRMNALKSGENSARHLATRAQIVAIGRWFRMTFFLLDHLDGSGKPKQNTFFRYVGALADYVIASRRLKHLPPSTSTDDTTVCTQWIAEHRRLAEEPVEHGEIRLNVVIEPRRP